ncbi:hypothetical protein HDU76_010774, partial [Blyttiomyces sp. JEL0837]
MVRVHEATQEELQAALDYYNATQKRTSLSRHPSSSSSKTPGDSRFKTPNERGQQSYGRTTFPSSRSSSMMEDASEADCRPPSRFLDALEQGERSVAPGGGGKRGWTDNVNGREMVPRTNDGYGRDRDMTLRDCNGREDSRERSVGFSRGQPREELYGDYVSNSKVPKPGSIDRPDRGNKGDPLTLKIIGKSLEFTLTPSEEKLIR